MIPIIDDFVAPVCKQEIEILHVTDDFLLINKPSGLFSLSGKNPLNKDSVHSRLVKTYPTACLVHRLDLGTSGLMLIALNKQANANLAKQFQMRAVTKTYVAILAGHVLDDSGYIEAPIAKDPQLFPRLKICARVGKAARTRYCVLARTQSPDKTRVRYEPETGRTHQLRLHSEYIGHPILGCDLYGTESSFVASPRLLLHAESLGFADPKTGKDINVFCPSPF